MPGGDRTGPMGFGPMSGLGEPALRRSCCSWLYQPIGGRIGMIWTRKRFRRGACYGYPTYSPMPQPLPPIPAMDPVILSRNNGSQTGNGFTPSQRQRTLRLNWKQSIKELMN